MADEIRRDSLVVEIGGYASKTGSVEFTSWAEVNQLRGALSEAAADAGRNTRGSGTCWESTHPCRDHSGQPDQRPR